VNLLPAGYALLVFAAWNILRRNLLYISMTILQTSVELMDGTTSTLSDLAKGPILIVNVASKCGLTPQYTALEALQKKYAPRGFTVVGVPSNQFFQELSDDAEIETFCSTTYGVTFPLTVKSKVNGRSRTPLYKQLVTNKDASGLAGPVLWNFEKFLVLPTGKVHRFRPTTAPDAPEIVELIEANLS